MRERERGNLNAYCLSVFCLVIVQYILGYPIVNSCSTAVFQVVFYLNCPIFRRGLYDKVAGWVVCNLPSDWEIYNNCRPWPSNWSCRI